MCYAGEGWLSVSVGSQDPHTGCHGCITSNQEVPPWLYLAKGLLTYTRKWWYTLLCSACRYIHLTRQVEGFYVVIIARVLLIRQGKGLYYSENDNDND